MKLFSAPASGTRRERRERARQRSRHVKLALAGGAAAVVLTAGTVVAVTATAAPESRPGAGDPTPVAPITAPPVGVVSHYAVTEQVELPPESITRKDGYLPRGTTKVISRGKPGVAEATFLVTASDGREIDRYEVATVIVSHPKHDVVAVGTLDVPDRGSIAAGSTREIGQEMAAERYGWDGVQWKCLDNLWERESNWRTTADNPWSSAYGIPQALPGSKMSSHGADWKTNPRTQIAWGLDYIKARYGTPCYAWGFWNDHDPHWY